MEQVADGTSSRLSEQLMEQVAEGASDRASSRAWSGGRSRGRSSGARIREPSEDQRKSCERSPDHSVSRASCGRFVGRMMQVGLAAEDTSGNGTRE